VDINSAVGRKAGLSDEKLLAATHPDIDLSKFTDTERLVIELADRMADTPPLITEDLFARLKAQFSDEQLIELSSQLAFENYRARMNRVFDVPSDELYKPGEPVSQSRGGSGAS
jgi:alkylhydroperoxidase family enzyme